MADWDVKVSGFKEIDDALLSLESGEKADAIQLEGLRAAGAIIKPALIAATPIRKSTAYGKSLPAGALRAAVRSSARIGKAGEPSVETVSFGKLSYIAYIVDHGHINANAIHGRTHTPPHPFIRGVEEATREKAAEAYYATVQAGINKVLEGK